MQTIDTDLLDIPEVELAAIATALQHGGLHGLEADDFESPAGRRIWKAIERNPDDWMLVAEDLNAAEDDRPWLPRLATIRWECSRPVSAIRPYVRRLKERRALRGLGETFAEVSAGREDLAQLRAKMNALEAAGAAALDAVKPIKAGLAEMIDSLDPQTGIASCPTGLNDLDDKLGGIRPSHFVVIGARPAMGKTALLLNLAVNYAKQGMSVALISAEQPASEIVIRMAAIVSGANLSRMTQRKMDQPDWDRVNHATMTLKDYPISISDASSPLIEDVAAVARRLKEQGKCDVVLVDYLQKLRSSSRDDYRLQVADIASRLKDLARDLNVPVIALAQCKREVEQRPLGTGGLGRLPRMSDLAESGVIEQEADIVLTLLRPSAYQEEMDPGLAYIRICKNRHGPVGMVKLAWIGESLKFDSLAKGWS